MIVVYTDRGWQVTTQRAHGILAAQIALNWKIVQRPGRWLETLLAIAEHDDAENELDGENLLTASGGPLNYTMKSFDLAHCEKLDRHAATKSQYISLLTSMHMEFLYGEEAKKNKIARRFLRKQHLFRVSACRQLSIPMAELKCTYSFLEWCDALSLILCGNQVPPENRKLEVSAGADKVCYEVFQLHEKQIVIEPWPFESSAFSVHFETRAVERMHFDRSADFRAAFLNAPVSEIEWKIVKKPSGYKKRKKV
jgi:Protein of unknown function (DUF3891)